MLPLLITAATAAGLAICCYNKRENQDLPSEESADMDILLHQEDTLESSSDDLLATLNSLFSGKSKEEIAAALAAFINDSSVIVKAQ